MKTLRELEEEDLREQPERKEVGRRMLLVTLLIVLGIFGYLYFFTDLIRSHGTPHKPVKAPLRTALPRKGGPGVSVPLAPPDRAGVVAQTGGKPASVPTTTSPAKTAPPAITPVKPSAPPARKEGVAIPRYAVRCGPFTSESEFISARAALKKAGLKPVASRGSKRRKRINLLYIAKYADPAVASAAMQKRLEAAPDAFILPIDGAYELFAGVYRTKKEGLKEQERLSTWGVASELRRVVIPSRTRRLTAGAFPTREAADALAESLRKEGISSEVTVRR